MSTTSRTRRSSRGDSVRVMPPVVQVNNLRKRYGEIEAVRGISFQVETGEVFGLLGPNGAGKTTTVEILEGLRKADGGAATVAGVRSEERRVEKECPSL